MKKEFIKMQGLGNDFVVFDAREQAVPMPRDRIRAICDRRLGVGADMVIMLEKPRKVTDAYAFMGIFNCDGSEVEACGNAARCVAGLMMAETGQKSVVIETVVGRLEGVFAGEGSVTVDMGEARLSWQEIPLSHEKDLENIDTDIKGLPAASAVNIGNPHAVFFVENAEALDLAHLGPQVENHPLFPARTNVELVHVIGPNVLRMRVWERGVGITAACGSGACATAVAAIRKGLVAGRKATVRLDGGDLQVEWRDDSHVIMTGPWAEVYRGEIAL